jgi:hypothetical protein
MNFCPKITWSCTRRSRAWVSAVLLVISMMSVLPALAQSTSGNTAAVSSGIVNEFGQEVTAPIALATPQNAIPGVDVKSGTLVFSSSGPSASTTIINGVGGSFTSGGVVITVGTPPNLPNGLVSGSANPGGATTSFTVSSGNLAASGAAYMTASSSSSLAGTLTTSSMSSLPRPMPPELTDMRTIGSAAQTIIGDPNVAAAVRKLAEAQTQMNDTVLATLTKAPGMKAVFDRNPGSSVTFNLTTDSQIATATLMVGGRRGATARIPLPTMTSPPSGRGPPTGGGVYLAPPTVPANTPGGGARLGNF